MALLRLNNSDPQYRQLFGSSDIKHFNVYINRNEQVGKSVDVLVDEAQSFLYLLIDLYDKQVLLPLGQTQIDAAGRAIYIIGISKGQIANLPPYNPAAYASAPGTVLPSNRYQDESTLHEPAKVREPAREPVRESYTSTSGRDYQNAPGQREPVRDEYLSTMPSQNYQEPVTPREPIGDRYAPIASNRTHIQPADTVVERSPTRENRATANDDYSDYSNTEEIVRDFLRSGSKNIDDETIRLLQERLVVDREKHKVGEVIVRKEVETRMVEVPIRTEKLVVEQISPEHKQLASIDLSNLGGQSPESGIQIQETTHPTADGLTRNSASTVSGEFSSARTASQFLQAIADQQQQGYETVQIKIVVNNPELRDMYQQWLERYSAIQSL